jgi:hypothetical protein
MSKGKYNRKREHARQKAEQEVSKIRFPDAEVVSPEKQPKTAQKSNPQRSDKKEIPMGFRESVKRSSFTDWCIASFTLVLSVVAIYQYVVMGGQLDVMRKDQRPWIKLAFNTLTLKVGSPIGGNLHTTNNGKTPAKKFEGKFAIEKVKNGEQPRLDYGTSWVKFTGGAVFPNDPQVQAVNMTQTVNHPSGPAYEAVTLNQVDWDDYTRGNIFFVAYGSISYSDFFRVQHWTKYCTFVGAPESPATVSPKQFTAQNCTDYNDVDDN